ncbi:hypothetical protein [Hymenobacter antarcticus]|uniref:Uncharacterized protein n=1 Tax=Hymenobacter antarcticus TaxID=486270 RepID=A0ABP7PXF6_9BACT
MNTLKLTIPLTIPQLAEMLHQQFSAKERQQLVELMEIPKPNAKRPKKQLPSVADDLREAFIELKQYQRGEKQLQTLDDFLNELKHQALGKIQAGSQTSHQQVSFAKK